MLAPSPTTPGSQYLTAPTRTLQDACRDTGRNERGRACPACEVKDICDGDRTRATRSGCQGSQRR